MLNKIPAAIAAWLLVCGGLAIFFISPEIANFLTIKENIDKQESTIASNIARSGQIQEFREFYKSQNANLSSLDSSFVDQQKPIDFIDFLENAAKDSQVALDISPGAAQAQKKDLWPSANFQLSLTGSFPSIVRFIKTIESSHYLVRISDATVSQKNAGANGQAGQEAVPASDGQLRASLSILVYANAKN